MPYSALKCTKPDFKSKIANFKANLLLVNDSIQRLEERGLCFSDSIAIVDVVQGKLERVSGYLCERWPETWRSINFYKSAGEEMLLIIKRYVCIALNSSIKRLKIDSADMFTYQRLQQNFNSRKKL